MAKEGEASFNACAVAGAKTCGQNARVLAGIKHRLPHSLCVIRVNEQLKANLL